MLGGNVLKRRSYHTLDGLRGIAALSIVILHTPHFLGWWNLPSTFLSVDLFFVLSGFVLATAYERRFGADISIMGFLWVRIVRLYPLYILGTALGVPVALLAMKFGGGGLTVPWTRTLLTTSLPLSALMLPTPNIVDSEAIYPFNPVLWSIFFELFINVIYVSFWRYLRYTSILLLTVGVSAICLIVYGLQAGTLDGGYAWNNLLSGFFRVFFSFFCGVVIFRFHGTYKRQKMSAFFFARIISVRYCHCFQLQSCW